MTFLPIVERELRTRARSQFTYWSRVGAAAFALVILAAMYLIEFVSSGTSFKSGYEQFQVVKWMSFALACSAGLFLTADALSEEKREGTIGLLFLTDLRGYDIVGGKLMANSLQAAYGLLAAFPVMALPLLAGGVSGSEFWRTLLIICNTLLLSLAAGLWVSSVSRDGMKALNGTLLIMLILLAGLPLGDFALAHWDPTKFVARLSLGSPAFLLATTGLLWSGQHWTELEIQFGCACAFLALSSVCIPRMWQEKTTAADSRSRSWLRAWRFGTSRRRVALRRKLFQRDPVFWLAMRDRWLPRLAWAVTLLGLALQVVRLVYHKNSRVFVTIAELSYGFIALVIYLWVASQAVRFFVEAIQNGSMELLLVTPVTPKRIVRSQWTALWRIFLMPALFVIGMRVVALEATLQELRKAYANAKGINFGAFNPYHYQIVSGVCGLFEIITTLLALAWFGMWMGLTSRKSVIALLKTFGFVVVLPWLAFMFISIAIEAIPRMPVRGGAAPWPFWTSEVVTAVMDLSVNCFFVFWARHKLLTRFRDAVARDKVRKRFQPARPQRKVLGVAPVPTAVSQ